MGVSLDATAAPDLDYAVRVTKLAQDQQRAEGKAAVDLIEQASAPPLGPHGQGSIINTHA